MKKVIQNGSLAGNYTRVRIDTDKLENIHNVLMSQFITRVGILGGKTTRHQTIRTRAGAHKAGRAVVSQTNAEIGLLHEKGSLTQRIPRRSFLEMPLVLKSLGLMSIKLNLWHFFMSGEHSPARLRDAYVKLGLMAERIIQSAFETRGFGRWAADSEQTIRRKKSDAPLIDTGQLRRSITSDVVDR
jgi:hypothetical protein